MLVEAMCRINVAKRKGKEKKKKNKGGKAHVTWMFLHVV